MCFEAAAMPWQRPEAAAPPVVAQRGLLVDRLIAGEDHADALEPLAQVSEGETSVRLRTASPGPEAPPRLHAGLPRRAAGWRAHGEHHAVRPLAGDPVGQAHGGLCRDHRRCGNLQPVPGPCVPELQGFLPAGRLSQGGLLAGGVGTVLFPIRIGSTEAGH